MTKFEQALIEEIKRIRDEAQNNTDWTDFELGVIISGRTHSGELDISFTCGGYPAVEANSFDAAIQEYCHRKGFERRNRPLCLSYDGEIVDE